MYPKSREKMTEELFANPPGEYRGAPFWAWNHKLDVQTQTEHMDYFKEMGIGGFHMHCRTGLDTPYMGEEYMACIRACVDKARENGMYAYLYDEDRWPSGFGGGLVTKNPEYSSRYLVFTSISGEERERAGSAYSSAMKVSAQGDGRLLARYDVVLEDACLKEYRRLADGEEAKGKVWYLYEETAQKSPWYNNETYVDTLNPDATRKFIEVTHEKYYELLKDDFGKTVPSIFTDEPQFSHKTTLGFAEAQEDVILPFTDALPEKYEAAYGMDFYATVPELIWELPEGRVSAARYRYHDFVAELFASSFADVIGTWCSEHGIMLTGHMMEEPTLASQTQALGEAMRSYRSFQLPGIDMLCDWREYTTAKQAQSASHQFGCPGVLSELYGVTNWDFDFRRHKLAGDWQAVLGVTLRVHHLAWDSMEAEAKRDYPASIFYQSPWYREYGMVEDHFARVNTALTRGRAKVRIGVIHPVESYWLHFGPKEQTALIRDELEEHFNQVTQWLLFSQLDFDFIAESLLPRQQEQVVQADQFHVGKMVYDAVIVPGCETLRSTTLERLEAFRQGGGTVIFMGDAPKYENAVSSETGKELWNKCRRIGFSRSALTEALEVLREVELRDANGRVPDHLIYQMREDGTEQWLFIANARKDPNPDIPGEERITCKVRGSWTVEEYDTLTGRISPLQAVHTGKNTEFIRSMYEHDSLLVRLIPCAEALPPDTGSPSACGDKGGKEQTVCRNADIVAYHLSEPNVLLLDMAEYRLDDGEWQEREEILRIDDTCRKLLGYQPRNNDVAQPWTIVDRPQAEHTLELRFQIESDIPVNGALLALERAQEVCVTLNTETADRLAEGYFVDESIRMICLPRIPAGTSLLTVRMPYAAVSNPEWHYLLGAFGVKVSGTQCRLTALPETVSFGDYTLQGFPFYAGNMEYETQLTLKEEQQVYVEVTKYRAALLKVVVDGEDRGRIAFAPYRLDLGRLGAGTHRITYVSYGNRVNAFGAVHNCDESWDWFGPDAWRTTDSRFSYEYQLKRMGILKAPVVRLLP